MQGSGQITPTQSYSTWRKKGLLDSRWVRKNRDAGAGKVAQRKHIYGLSKLGSEEYDLLTKEAIGLVMERFFFENLSLEDLTFHIQLTKEFFSMAQRSALVERRSALPFRVVIASPEYDPMVCYPKFYYAMSEAYPNATIYVIKSPWGKPLEGRPNLTFLDGSRSNIPLKDEFADCLLLMGFPRSSTTRGTVDECLRVLKDDGLLFVEIPEAMIIEKNTGHNTVLPEYFLKLFYEFHGHDRVVSVKEVKQLLSRHIDILRTFEVRRKLVIFGSGKVRKIEQMQNAIKPRNQMTRKQFVRE